jgi:hypothetical protein
MSNRLFRLANLIDYKYNLRIAATEVPIPAPSKIIDGIKRDIIVLYNNMFNDQGIHKVRTTSTESLFELRDLGEPNIVGIFDLMHKLVANLETMDIVDLYKYIATILDKCNKSVGKNVVGDFLMGYNPETGEVDKTVRINRPSIRNRMQLLRGLENRMKTVTGILSKMLKTLKRFVPENTPLLTEDNKQLNVGVVDIPSSTLEEPLIIRFLQSPGADRYGLNRSNWDSMFTDPTLRQRLVRLVHSWKKNNSVFNLELITELDNIIQEYRSRQKNNIDYLNKGETAAPSTPTSVPPETINMFDTFHTGNPANPSE